MAKTILVTGSSGLIGSEVSVYFASLGYTVHGVDNNQRAVFFGPQGDTRWNQNRLAQQLKGFVHHELDIRDRAGVLALVKMVKPSVIVHTGTSGVTRICLVPSAYWTSIRMPSPSGVTEVTAALVMLLSGSRSHG